MWSLQAKRLTVVFLAFALSAISFYIVTRSHGGTQGVTKRWRLYWFVPDGLRADPEIFKVFDWAREGHLPNIARMMKEGAYGYSIPVFPSHTPINFATLFTGVAPLRHGVADGPIRVQGYPLNLVPRSGFSSVAKTIDPFWYSLEQAGMIVSLLSVPGSTPPEITTGNVVKGRWGGWGVDFPNIIFHSKADREFREKLGWNDKVFQFGKQLTEFVDAKPPQGWMQVPQSFSPPREVSLRNWESDLFMLLLDRQDDGKEEYDHAIFSADKKTILANLKVGAWSDWFPLELNYRLQRAYQANMPQRLEVEQELSKLSFPSRLKVKVIKLGKKDFFRVRVLYDGLNESLTMPQTLSEELHESAGPMVDFVDNFPPQLVYFDEDKQTFLEESAMSFGWHHKALRHFLEQVPQDVFIQSIYSPNQMLTSRWWLGFIDPHGHDFKTASSEQKESAKREVLDMYREVDKMIGEALDRRSSEAYVVVSSDHGAVPLNWEVRLNNLFAQKGWLNFRVDKQTGIPQIDWTRTKVVFLNMNHVFLHPDGLAGNYRPGKGAAYEKLRNEVAEALRGLKDKDGISPLADLRARERAADWGLPGDRIGDLVIANRAGYGWIEDVSKDLQVFTTSNKAGYKQAVLPDEAKGLWTPFLIVGPGIRAGHEISRPIRHVEQYPTVMKLLNVKPPYAPDAEALAEIFSGDVQ